jgi:Ca2+-binding RTX toxin-like protein
MRRNFVVASGRRLLELAVSDTLEGTEGPDVIVGLAGADDMYGYGGPT